MKRRSFIQGMLALLGATVAAKALPEPKPRMLTNEFPNGITARYYGGDGTGKLYYIGGEPAWHGAQFYDSGGNPVGGPTLVRIP